MTHLSIALLAIAALFSPSLHAENFSNSSERPLLVFHTVPAQPKVGEKLALFIQADSGVLKQEVVLDAAIDGVPQSLKQTAEALWSASLAPFSEIKNHQMSVNISVRDAKESKRLRAAMRELQDQIDVLNQQIAAETNETKKNALIAVRDEKQSYKDELETNLDNIKVFLKSENYAFAVAADPNNADYPQLVSVTPNAVPLNKQARLTLNGTHFPANPHVKIDGVDSSLISATDSSIAVLSPAFAATGAKNIEISFPADASQPAKNAILSSAFFVSDRAVLTNLKPVAVTNGYINVNWPPSAPAVLDASHSYDENGDAFNTEWKFLSSPKNSSFAPGASLPNGVTASFTPDKKGVYSIQCTLREISTDENLSSSPNIVTVEVK